MVGRNGIRRSIVEVKFVGRLLSARLAVGAVRSFCAVAGERRAWSSSPRSSFASPQFGEIVSGQKLLLRAMRRQPNSDKRASPSGRGGDCGARGQGSRGPRIRGSATCHRAPSPFGALKPCSSETSSP